MRAYDQLAAAFRGLPVSEDDAVIFLLGFLAEEGRLPCELEDFVAAGEAFRDSVQMTKELWLSMVSAMVDAQTETDEQRKKLDLYFGAQSHQYRQTLNNQLEKENGRHVHNFVVKVSPGVWTSCTESLKKKSPL